MEEVKELIQNFTTAITRRMEDHDLLIELRSTQQNTLNQVNALVAEIPKRYVTADQFEPVRKVVYGLVTIILTAIVAAILAVVIRK